MFVRKLSDNFAIHCICIFCVKICHQVEQNILAKQKKQCTFVNTTNRIKDFIILKCY